MMIRGDVDLVKQIVVQVVLYKKMELKSRPPVLKVSYLCGQQLFHEVVFLENEKFARTIACRWWILHSIIQTPNTVAEALTLLDSIREPKVIWVRINTKYPQVVNYWGERNPASMWFGKDSVWIGKDSAWSRLN